jgi:hypothetical protein
MGILCQNRQGNSFLPTDTKIPHLEKNFFDGSKLSQSTWQPWKPTYSPFPSTASRTFFTMPLGSHLPVRRTIADYASEFLRLEQPLVS